MHPVKKILAGALIISSAGLQLAGLEPAVAHHDWYHNVVTDAAITHGVNPDYLYYQVMGCETGYTYNPWTTWGPNGEYGPFQFMPATYARFGGTDITNPTEQAYIAAWAFANGYSGEWVCA